MLKNKNFTTTFLSYFTNHANALCLVEHSEGMVWRVNIYIIGVTIRWLERYIALIIAVAIHSFDYHIAHLIGTHASEW